MAEINPIPIFLTSREEEIIYLLLLNYTEKQIAYKFQLSDETIGKLVENIIEKLDKVLSGGNYYLANYMS